MDAIYKFHIWQLFLYKFHTLSNLINSRNSLPVLQLGWTDLLEDAAYDRVIQWMNFLLQRAGELVLDICWPFSVFKSPSHEKTFFLKICGFISFKFFQGHNWLTKYPDAEFHSHWKTVTSSSIGPNLSKHWRFLALWLSLCFGTFLLFLVCHDTALVKHACNDYAWLTTECSPRYDNLVWENRRASCHVMSAASWVLDKPNSM